MAYLPLNFGNTTLSLGEKVIADQNIQSTSQILVSNVGTVGTIGILSVRITAGSSFTINSSNILDSSSVNYVIVY
jgi:hypothetical protein